MNLSPTAASAARLGTFDKPRPDLAAGSWLGPRAVQHHPLAARPSAASTASLSPDSAKTLAAFDHAIALAQGMDPNLDAITDPQGWLKLEILQQAVRATRDTALAELGPALGVELGFNSQDGD